MAQDQPTPTRLSEKSVTVNRTFPSQPLWTNAQIAQSRGLFLYDDDGYQRKTFIASEARYSSRKRGKISLSASPIHRTTVTGRVSRSKVSPYERVDKRIEILEPSWALAVL
jgi:hypothetical protein